MLSGQHGIYNNYRVSLDLKKCKEFIPQEHQTQCLKYFANVIMNSNDIKGLLLYHKLGSGKTATSLMISNYLLENKKIEHVYIMTPGSLRGGWFKEYTELCGYSHDLLQHKYTFITYNYAVGKKVSTINFDNTY